jgi:hypothetical protein
VLAPESLYEVVAIQHDEMPDWPLSELPVHMGYVEPEPVEAAVADLLLDCCVDLLAWTQGSWRFRRGERTRDDVGVPFGVADLLAQVGLRVTAASQRRDVASRTAATMARESAVVVLEAEAAAPSSPLGSLPAGWLEGEISDEEAAAVAEVARREESAAPASAQSEQEAEEETDTASLMCELSSLGRGDRPRPATAIPPPRPEHRVPALDRAAAKKRKGRFGR